MTETFGPIGFGWYYSTSRTWTEEANGEVSAHVEIELYIKVGDEWSKPISGIGGSMLLAKEKNGPHHSDEAYKMATTDALSVAMKQIGVGADVYMGRSDSKYSKPIESKPLANENQRQAIRDWANFFKDKNNLNAVTYLNECDADTKLTYDQAEKVIKHAEDKAKEYGN